MSDLTMPRHRRPSRLGDSTTRPISTLQSRLAFRLVLVLLPCLVLAGCAGAKKPAKSVSPAATPPPPALQSPAPAPPTPKKGLFKRILSRLTLAPKPLHLKASIAPFANNNSPVELDVVLIRDKSFWKTAPSMSAKDWFAQKSDLERRYRNKLVVSSWEWVPGQPINPIAIRVPRRVNGAMVFASYPTPGTHSAPIPKGGSVSISLQENDFTLEVRK